MRTKTLWDSMREAVKKQEQAESKEEQFLYYLEERIRNNEAFIVSESEMTNFLSHDYKRDYFYFHVGAVQVLREAYTVYTQLFGIDKDNEPVTGNKPTEEEKKK